MCSGERNILLMVSHERQSQDHSRKVQSKVGNIYTNMLVWVLSLALVGTPIVIDFHGNGK